MPSWVPVVTALGLCGLLVLTINFRAYSELRKETEQFDSLNSKIQQASTENLALQEEIHYLKNDPNTIEREVKKFGLAAPKAEVKQPEEVKVQPAEEAKKPESAEPEKKIAKPEVKAKEKEKTAPIKDPKKDSKAAAKIEPPRSKKEKVSRAGETDKAEKSANRQKPTRK